MSHADTIRRLLPLWHVGGTQGDRLRSELEAMEAENQRLRERLKAACEPCAECGHIDWRELDDILDDTDREQPLVAASGVEPVPGSSTHAPEALAGDAEQRPEPPLPEPDRPRRY